jgi:hypothetical protein
MTSGQIADNREQGTRSSSVCRSERVRSLRRAGREAGNRNREQVTGNGSAHEVFSECCFHWRRVDKPLVFHALVKRILKLKNNKENYALRAAISE